MIVITFEVWCFIENLLNKKNFIDENKSIEKLEETLLIDKDEFIPSDFLKQFNVSKHLMKDYLQILENSLENIFQKSSRKFCLLKGLEETHVTATPTGKGIVNSLN